VELIACICQGNKAAANASRNQGASMNHNPIPPETVKVPRACLSEALAAYGQHIVSDVRVARILKRPALEWSHSTREQIKRTLATLPRKYRAWAIDWLRLGTKHYRQQFGEERRAA
jgi:hypothetical protein